MELSILSIAIGAVVGGGVTLFCMYFKVHQEVVRRTTAELELSQERKTLSDKIQLLGAAEDKFKDTFKALSADAVEKLQQRANLDLQNREKSIATLVSPVKEALQGVEGKLRELEKARVGAYEVLKHQVSDMVLSQKELRLETANLVKALRAPAVRGRWGEMQLRRVVEMAGLSAHCDFIEQVSLDSEEGRLRPDMIVNLPGGQHIVIDAKAPLAAYLESLEATDDATRIQKLRDHARQVRNHITALSSRTYWDKLPINTSPEFVVLFLPGETFFSAALEHDPSLIEMGVEKQVIITTPSTLIAMLHVIAYGWRQEKLAENAQEISVLGKELYKRVADMGGHMSKLGRDLGLAVKSYNNTVGSLERRVLPSARKFKELETTSSKDEIAELQQIDLTTREPQAQELAG